MSTSPCYYLTASLPTLVVSPFPVKVQVILPIVLVGKVSYCSWRLLASAGAEIRILLNSAGPVADLNLSRARERLSCSGYVLTFSIRYMC